ncbi:PTS sugar transporter subunit IIA [Isoptericola sp. b490]|uniref:PTS sugar transporter subunit IIA n=1 Tax=Actinotalea lenta TaxID=3064654 RepID=UPI002713C0BB|nr:PTS sugar transporter subunit IIA [Isoptericola sp. b490]MDO8122358.1 PTS sugar transporter subunit IIA [Isoptericola sp. b490]
MSDINLAVLLARESIRLDEKAADKKAAIEACGRALVEAGVVEEAYVPAMLEREKSISTHIGEGVAIPHATLAGKEAVLRDGLCFLRFPEGVDWDGSTVTICIGIAAQGDGHVDVLAQLAQILMVPEQAEALRNAADPDTVLRMLTPSPANEGE